MSGNRFFPIPLPIIPLTSGLSPAAQGKAMIARNAGFGLASRSNSSG